VRRRIKRRRTFALFFSGAKDGLLRRHRRALKLSQGLRTVSDFCPVHSHLISPPHHEIALIADLVPTFPQKSGNVGARESDVCKPSSTQCDGMLSDEAANRQMIDETDVENIA
jgi:hypothetical protein